MPGPTPIPLAERYSVDPDTGCWLFQGARSAEGYGNVRVRGRIVKAHRLAAHLWLGFALDSEECILHSCDNPPCINPAHLRPGTKAENSGDMVKRQRQHIPGIAGEEHWNARLTTADVAAIRSRVAAGERQRAVARDFGIHQSQVSKIVNGKARAR